MHDVSRQARQQDVSRRDAAEVATVARRWTEDMTLRSECVDYVPVIPRDERPQQARVDRVGQEFHRPIG